MICGSAHVCVLDSAQTLSGVRPCLRLLSDQRRSRAGALVILTVVEVVREDVANSVLGVCVRPDVCVTGTDEAAFCLEK